VVTAIRRDLKVTTSPDYGFVIVSWPSLANPGALALVRVGHLIL